METNYDFSILIPTWNNLEYLKLCIDSIRKNCRTNCQIIVFLNEASDGSLEWVSGQADLEYLYDEQNVGICIALNRCRPIIRSKYVIYLNDDMYVLPGWDARLLQEIDLLDTHLFMLSATMIEPLDTGNPCVVVQDHGRTIKEFREAELLENYRDLFRKDWNGSTWPPVVVPLQLWDEVGGMSIEFSPGMYSDPDLSMKLYRSGVRTFKGIGDSLVYHFGSRSTKRMKHNAGRKQFLMKWGMTAGYFTRKILRRGEPIAILPKEHQMNRGDKIVNRYKKIFS